MESWRRERIEEVYSKWEKRGRGGRGGRGARGAPSPALVGQNSKQVAWQQSGVGRPLQYPKGSVANRFNRRSRRTNESILTPLTTFVPSLGVDTNALHAANLKKYTSITRCCQLCAPASRNKYYSDDSPGSGLQNILVIDKRRYPGILGLLFPYLMQSVCAKFDYSMDDLREDTLNSTRVMEAIESCAKATAENDPAQYERTLKEQQQRARQIIHHMSSSVYSVLTRFVAWLLFWVFGHLFNQVCVQKKHVDMLRMAQKQRVPMVFLPAHKSHMDYVIMTFVLFNLDIHIPRIAAGDNLQIPIVSWLLTHLGGFFIKRKLDSATGKDVLFRNILHEYVERCLIAGENMEFFIEGSRSRSGKTTSPKAGLLSVLMDTVREGIVEDILVIPVNISYDKLLEKTFIGHELMGGSKKAETFLDSLKGAWSMITTNIGSVRIDFAQPLSLQEYLISASISEHSLLEVSNLSRSRSVTNLVDLNHRRLVTAASHHIVYDISQTATLTATGMVSFLLLTKYRQGTSISELIEGYAWLEKKTQTKGRAVAFTGEPSEAVHYALNYLSDFVLVEKDKPSLVSTKKNKSSRDNSFVMPQLELPNVLTLLHYSNQVAPLLVLEGVVALSVLSAADEVVNGTLEVDREEVIEDAQFICQLLAREFTFAPPCVDLWSVLNDTLETFVVFDMLKVQQSVQNSTGGRKLPLPLDCSDDEDEFQSGVMLEVNTDTESMKHLTFLGRIIDPFIEAYWMSCVCLCQEDEGTGVQESDFLKALQKKMIDKNDGGLLKNVESCSMDTLRNAVKSFVDMKLVSYVNGSQVLRVEPALIDMAESLIKFKRMD